MTYKIGDVLIVKPAFDMHTVYAKVIVTNLFKDSASGEWLMVYVALDGIKRTVYVETAKTFWD